MKSKTQLFKDLKQIDHEYFNGVDLDHSAISNETYGKDSFIYVKWKNPDEKRIMEIKLSEMGHTITEYSIDNVSSIQVSYFKGWHWNE